MATTRAVYQLKITLQDIEPSIWRRIQVWENITLTQLHETLQIVMSWEDYHLHEFKIGRRIFSVPDPDDERTVVDESQASLCEIVPHVGTQFLYLYDFGDNWRHDLLLEAILLPEPEALYPRCISGDRRTPPEDVGGSTGYQEYLEALGNPRHAEHESVLLWRGPFNPQVFSSDEVNQQLRKTFRSARKRKLLSVAHK
jgi:Plasmid pRiA4b ORF-3-like protein